MPTKKATDGYRHEPVRTYPYGNPNTLLKRIADTVDELDDDDCESLKSAMAGIETILRQNKRI